MTLFNPRFSSNALINLFGIRAEIVPDPFFFSQFLPIVLILRSVSVRLSFKYQNDGADQNLSELELNITRRIPLDSSPLSTNPIDSNAPIDFIE
jgi:hypothetical protein